MMKSVSALGAALPALVVETCGAPVFERPLKVVHNATARTRGNAVLSAVHRLQQRIIAAYFTPMGLICTAIGLSLILIGVRVLWVALGCECVQPPWLVWLLQNANVARNSRLSTGHSCPLPAHLAIFNNISEQTAFVELLRPGLASGESTTNK
eukprot:TRINITY_DN10068_c0_g1_i2.p1 TRINITY_DN10068_c0_g1~~TRINITY_DN10068_c0_g1_i2.p1  ORF type:complete len:153 (-),score=13.71 TRINITY_DN10068_c0_g1_i2:133-591(-)